MTRVAITGANGIIGSVMVSGLTEYEITPLDRPEHDARDFGSISRALKGHDAVVHLAWKGAENFASDRIEPDNQLMVHNVYKAALESNVPKVVMASSVHADSVWPHTADSVPKDGARLHPSSLPTPDGPYGASKVFMESLGRWYAARGLDVTCIRFGGVNPADEPPSHSHYEAAVWLSHDDAVGAVRSCLDADNDPGRFAVFYAVSENQDKFHDTTNPFGWTPA